MCTLPLNQQITYLFCTIFLCTQSSFGCANATPNNTFSSTFSYYLFFLFSVSLSPLFFYYYFFDCLLLFIDILLPQYRLWFNTFLPSSTWWLCSCRDVVAHCNEDKQFFVYFFYLSLFFYIIKYNECMITKTIHVSFHFTLNVVECTQQQTGRRVEISDPLPSCYKLS